MMVSESFLVIIWEIERRKMIKYSVSLSKRAKKQLDKLSDNIAKPIFQAIQELADNPRPQVTKS